MHLFTKCLLSVLLLFCLMPASTGHCAPEGRNTDVPLVPQARVDTDQVYRTLLPARQNPVPPLVLQDTLPLTTYLEYYVDPTHSTDISEMGTAKYADRFQLFAPDRLPRMEGGVTWLRFVLGAAQPGQESQRTVLDMGPSIPGAPILYMPGVNSMGAVEWKELHPENGVFMLPEAGQTPMVCYLRLDGLPGTWFSPQLRTIDAAITGAQDISLHKAGMVALIVVLLMCLFKALVEPGQWRMWAIFYLAAAILQAWSGLAPVNAGYSPKTLAGLTSAGLALMLWPHVARHILRCREHSRFLDAQFILLCLPGAAATLLPLVPPFQWVARYTELWPLAMVIFLPSALWACLCQTPACLRFLLGTLLPPLATAAGILGLRSGFPPDLLASLPVFGTALGALIVLSLERRGQAEAVPAPEQAMDQGLPADGLALHLDHGHDRSDDVISLTDLSPERGEAGQGEPYRSLLNALATFRTKAGPLAEQLSQRGRDRIDSLISGAREAEEELARLEKEEALARESTGPLRVIAVSQSPAFLAVLAHVLRGENCIIRRAENEDDAVLLARQQPARLYIFEGDFASQHAQGILAELRRASAGMLLPPVFLAYTPDESSWKDLARAGFTHALVLPIDDTALLNTLKEIREEQPQAGGKAPAAEPVRASGPDQAARPGETAGRPDDGDYSIPDIFGTAPASAPSGTPVSPVSPIAQARGNDDVLVLTMQATDGQVREAGSPAQKAGNGPLPTDPHDGLDEERQELLRRVQLARDALARGRFDEVIRQAGEIEDRSGDNSQARIAQLVIKAARSSDRTAVGDLLDELTSSIGRQSVRKG